MIVRNGLMELDWNEQKQDLRSRLLVLEGLQGNCLDRHDNGFVDSGEEGLTGKQRSKATKSNGRKETTPIIDARNTEKEREIYI